MAQDEMNIGEKCRKKAQCFCDGLQADLKKQEVLKQRNAMSRG